MKNTISELKNTVEGINTRIDEAEGQINKLGEKGIKKTPRKNKKGNKD